MQLGKCVVCSHKLGTAPLFANSWERSRKILGCCSEFCTAKFDPDAHWKPSVGPAIVTGSEERRLLALLQMQLSKGTTPTAVAREFLQAGLRADLVHGVISDFSNQITQQNKVVAAKNVLGVLGFLFAGFGRFHQTSVETTAQDCNKALDLVAEWNLYFGYAVAALPSAVVTTE
jgi:hypothetical protein